MILRVALAFGGCNLAVSADVRFAILSVRRRFDPPATGCNNGVRSMP
jgi:hypothetical protein